MNKKDLSILLKHANKAEKSTANNLLGIVAHEGVIHSTDLESVLEHPILTMKDAPEYNVFEVSQVASLQKLMKTNATVFVSSEGKLESTCGKRIPSIEDNEKIETLKNLKERFLYDDSVASETLLNFPVKPIIDTLKFSSNNPNKEVLQVCAFLGSKGQLCGTDGTFLKSSSLTGLEKDYLLPNRWEYLFRAFSKSYTDITFSEKKFVFNIFGFTFRCVTSPFNYPNVRQVIPRKEDRDISMVIQDSDKKELMKNLLAEKMVKPRVILYLSSKSTTQKFVFRSGLEVDFKAVVTGTEGFIYRVNPEKFKVILEDFNSLYFRDDESPLLTLNNSSEGVLMPLRP